MLLYIIRHGDPDYENDSLTPKGKLQAQAVAKRLAVHGIDRIFTSPLGRAKETAEPLCELLDKKAEVVDFLSEGFAHKRFWMKLSETRSGWNFFQHPDVMKAPENMDINIHDSVRLPFLSDKNFEKGYAELAEEADKFFEEQLGYKREGALYKILKPSDERVAFFCHQGLGLHLLSYLLAVPPHIFISSFDLTHSSITLLQFTNYDSGYTAPKCLTLSDTSHLYAEHLPLRYHNYLEY